MKSRRFARSLGSAFCAIFVTLSAFAQTRGNAPAGPPAPDKPMKAPAEPPAKPTAAAAPSAAPVPAGTAAAGTAATGDAPATGATPAAGAAAEAGAAPTAAAAENPAVTPAAASDTSPAAGTATLEARIETAKNDAEELRKNVWRLRGMKLLTPAQAGNYEAELDAWVATLGVAGDNIAQAEASQAADPKGAKQQRERVARAVKSAEDGLKATSAQLAGLEYTTGWDLVGTLLRARCSTAICFDNGDKKDWLGIEPLVELPTGKSFSLSSTNLSSYVDNHDLRIDLAAGARVWLFRDVMSVSVYISKPLTDAPVRLEGDSFVYPASSVRRPYPGIALGLLFDSLWLGFDREELRNGDGQDGAAVNPKYPPNEVISSSWTLTVALQPVTAFRSAIGTAVQATDKDSK